LRIQGWLIRDDGRNVEFFISAEGDYELRSAENDTLADSFAVVRALSEAAKPFMVEPKKSSDWD
jgi:hypothetical protein